MTLEPSTRSAFQRHLPLFHRVFAAVFSRRVLKLLGIFALGLVTLVALFYAIENWRGARAWKKVRDELRAKGEPLSFPELVPPMPADDENFAMTPFFRGFFDKSLSPDGKTPVWAVRQRESALPDWSNKLKDDRDWRLGERYAFTWNRRAAALQNAPLQKESAGEELALRGRSTDRNQLDGIDIVTNAPIEAVRLLLDQSRPVMDEIESAVRRPNSQFPIHYEDNFSALLPHLAKLKTLSWMFSLRALARLEAGDANGALADVTTTLRLVETLKSEPVLISGLVRIAMLGNSMQPLWQGLADGAWTPAQLQSLQTQLANIDLLAGYQTSMRGELAFALEGCDLIERDRNLDGIGSPDGASGPPSWTDVLFNLAPKGWYVYNKAVIARMHTELTLGAIDPVSRRYHAAKIGAYDSEVDRLVERDRRLFVARLILPAVGKATQKFVLAQTSLDQAVIACALERHRLARGSYPATLAELAPDHLTALPHDIMDGQPLRYRMEDGKFTLYSIGINGTDDGGQAAFKEVRDGKTWRREEGDWVWSYSKPANR